MEFGFNNCPIYAILSQQFHWTPLSPQLIHKEVPRCKCWLRNRAVARCRDCDILVCRVCIGIHRNCFTVELDENFYGPQYVETLFYCWRCKRFVHQCCSFSGHVAVQQRVLQKDVCKTYNEARLIMNDVQSYIANVIGYIKQICKDYPLEFQTSQSKFDKIIHDLHRFIPKYITSKTLLDNTKKPTDNAADIYNVKQDIEKLMQQRDPLFKDIDLYNNNNNLSVAFPFPPFCVLSPDSKPTITNQLSSFTIDAKDVANQPTECDPHFISIKCENVNNFQIFTQDDQHSKYIINYQPKTIGTIKISVKILNCHVVNSPLTVKVHVRDSTKIETPIAVFGTKGEADGQFSRPWGVCCDAQSRIIVADRSNHRVQVFGIDGRFLFKFGMMGSKIGEFNLPVGVAVDNECGRIVVADKANHRIQLFTMSGEFAHAFGKFGGGIGQLNYPWDVAVNSKHQILVADSRNHRMQLFDFSGQVVCFSSSLLHNYLPRNVSPSQLNSNFPPRNVSPSLLPKSAPRGLCFTCKDEILFSDFDLHNINFISSDLKMIRKAFGTQGDNVGQFRRPSGIGVDTEGNLIVVDSKNHRIQIFDSNGNFLHVFGKYGSEIGEFNCPTDVCVSPDGKIIVVDFENARVQIF
uniref:B box-type domain-containing protein n=1 Tax=Strigamia maritima TaxID=126957 RepID=T1J8Z2_STRMM